MSKMVERWVEQSENCLFCDQQFRINDDGFTGLKILGFKICNILNTNLVSHFIQVFIMWVIFLGCIPALHSHQDLTTIAAFILTLLTIVAILALEEHGISKKHIEAMVMLIVVRIFRSLMFFSLAGLVFGLFVAISVAMECLTSILIAIFGAHNSTKLSLSQKISARLVSIACAITYNGIVYLFIRGLLALLDLF